jgi:hypothetical protein
MRRPHGYESGAIAVAPDASWLAMGTREGLSLYEARTGRLGPSFPRSCADSVRWPGYDYGEWKPRPIFALNGSCVLVNDRVGNLVRIDMRKLACLDVVPRQAGLAWITQLSLFPDRRHLLAVGTDNSAAVWHLDPFAGVARSRAVDALPERVFDELHGGGDDDGYDDDDDYDDDDYDDEADDR